MKPKKLTGWLIVLMVITGPLGFSSGVKNLIGIEAEYKPYMADYPSLRAAVMLFQFLVGTGVFAWLCAAWMLYRREPGTLGQVITYFSVGVFLRLAGPWVIILFGGLPAEATQALLFGAFFGSFVVLCVSGAWLLYLVRSKKVREIYAAQPPIISEIISSESIL